MYKTEGINHVSWIYILKPAQMDLVLKNDITCMR